MEKFKIEEKIVAMLKTVYDPEIPVNVYDLGLIYKIDVSDNGEVALDMTLTNHWKKMALLPYRRLSYATDKNHP